MFSHDLIEILICKCKRNYVIVVDTIRIFHKVFHTRVRITSDEFKLFSTAIYTVS